MPISRASHASTLVPEQHSIEDTRCGHPGASRVEAGKSGLVAIPGTELCRSFQRVRTTTVPISITLVVQHSGKSVNCEGHLTWV